MYNFSSQSSLWLGAFVQWTTWTTVPSGPVQHPTDYITFELERTHMLQCCSTAAQTFEKGIPHDTFSQFSQSCTCRISSWWSHSHSCPHSAAPGGNGERRPRAWVSAPLLSWRSNSWECNCSAWRHHWACPGRLQETHRYERAHDPKQKLPAGVLGKGVGRCCANDLNAEIESVPGISVINLTWKVENLILFWSHLPFQINT